MAKKYNMVIVAPILERDSTHNDILANTAGESIHIVDTKCTSITYHTTLISHGNHKFVTSVKLSSSV